MGRSFFVRAQNSGGSPLMAPRDTTPHSDVNRCCCAGSGQVANAAFGMPCREGIWGCWCRCPSCVRLRACPADQLCCCHGRRTQVTTLHKVHRGLPLPRESTVSSAPSCVLCPQRPAGISPRSDLEGACNGQPARGCTVAVQTACFDA